MTRPGRGSNSARSRPRPAVSRGAVPPGGTGGWPGGAGSGFGWSGGVGCSSICGPTCGWRSRPQPPGRRLSGKLQTLHARTGGTVAAVNLKSGTALVEPGQQVEAGQALIGTARTERDGTPIFAPAAGSVTARFEWSAAYDQPLSAEVPLLTGRTRTELQLSCGGLRLDLPGWGFLRGDAAGDNISVTRHLQLELGGLPLPVSVKETVRYERLTGQTAYPDDLALAMARLHCQQALEADWPDAEVLTVKESVEMGSGTLHYAVTYTLLGDIVDW